MVGGFARDSGSFRLGALPSQGYSSRSTSWEGKSTKGTSYAIVRNVKWKLTSLLLSAI